MSAKKTIELRRGKDGKFHATSESLEVINSEKKDVQYFEKITEKKARSLQQLRYYWSVVLRLIGEHIDKLGDYVIDNDGKFDYTPLHRYLTMKVNQDV